MSRADLSATLQKHWALVTLAGVLVGAFGFQWMSPSRRLTVVETRQAAQVLIDARQDSAFNAHVRDKQDALNAIQRQLTALVAGQCVKERNEVARIAYGCLR